jgi:hypothetical protein
MKLKIALSLAILAVAGGALMSARGQSVTEGARRIPLLGKAVPGPHSLLSRELLVPSHAATATPEIAENVKGPAPKYLITSVDAPGQAYSLCYDFNDNAAVGIYQNNPDSSTSEIESFLLNAKGLTTVMYPGAVSTHAFGISASGEIVGYYVDTDNISHAFTDTGGVYTNIDFPGAGNGVAFDINDGGEVVGSYGDSAGKVHNFLLSGGAYTSFDYPGGAPSEAAGISNTGEIVGVWVDSSENVHGFVATSPTGAYTTIDYPGATLTQPMGINDAGEIAGTYQTGGGSFSAGFLYENGIFESFGVPGATLSALSRVKNNGRITGAWTDQLGEAHGLTGLP